MLSIFLKIGVGSALSPDSPQPLYSLIPQMLVMKKEVGVSLLSDDWSNIKRELARVKDADHIHLDVMDGHFVPNLSFGPHLGTIVRQNTQLPIWSHLMVDNPLQYIDAFAPFSDGIIIHQEIGGGMKQIKNILRAIQKHSLVGIALNPETPVRAVVPYLPLLDAVLLMSVHPGFGGQKFLPVVRAKCRALRALQKKYSFKIMVDGGITAATMKGLDADVVVAGTYVSSAKNPAHAIAALRK